MSNYRTVALMPVTAQTESLSLLSREWALVMILGEGDTAQDFTGDPGTVAHGWVSQCQGHVFSIRCTCA